MRKVFHVLAFVAWVVDPAKGHAPIRDFGKETFGAPLFFPDAGKKVEDLGK